MIAKREFPHHLIREIFEQPASLRRAIEPRVSPEEALVRLEGIRISSEELRCTESCEVFTVSAKAGGSESFVRSKTCLGMTSSGTRP